MARPVKLTPEEEQLILRLRKEKPAPKKKETLSEIRKRAAATRTANRLARGEVLRDGSEKLNRGTTGDPAQPLEIKRRGRKPRDPVHKAPSSPGDVEVMRIDPKWKSVITTCTNCGKVGPVDPVFGIRVVRGLEHKQSWCKSCRAETNYYRTKR